MNEDNALNNDNVMTEDNPIIEGNVMNDNRVMTEDNATNPAAERTLETIVTEIKMIKAQTQKILLAAAVEIGIRLLEAKEKVPFGDFTAWLENELQYSSATAYNLMNIAQAYSPGLSGAAGARAGAQAETLSKLGYTQAVVLLGIPENERAEFIAELDIDNMAVRELQQAVKERNQVLAENDKLRQTQNEQSQRIFQLSSDLYESKTNKATVWKEQDKVIKLQQELETFKSEDATARRIAKAELESKRAKSFQATAQADARFDLIVKGFDDLFTALRELGASHPDEFHQYLRNTHAFLQDTAKMLARIEKEGP